MRRIQRASKFIAKLLRHMDTSPIREKTERHINQSASATHQLHVIERWSGHLLKGDEHDINILVADYPDIDRQKLRQLFRDARKDQQAEDPSRSALLLFKYLGELLTSEEGANPR